MNIEGAKIAIRNDTIGNIGWGVASLVIAEALERDDQPKAEFQDILISLTRGEFASSIAVCVFYRKTGREWPSEPLSGVRDPEDWRKYLEANGFLKPNP